MTTQQADFIIQTSVDEQIYFTLRASNHKVVLTSETYTSIGAAHNGIEAVRTASQLGTNFVSRTATNGQPYFVLRAANHEVIGTSEMYSSNRTCQSATHQSQGGYGERRFAQSADRHDQ